MQWEDKAIILSSSKYGENSLIIHALTKNHGVHAGMFRGAKKNASMCQAGNVLNIMWKARLEEQLGTYSGEVYKSYSSLIFDSSLKLSALLSACAIIRRILPEREPNAEIYQAFLDLVEAISCGEKEDFLQKYIFLELDILTYMGYGLHLSECAATGTIDNLIYVSPKSGCAVSEEAGQPYIGKMLRLPPFVANKNGIKPLNFMEIIDGFALTRYFLEKYIFIPQNMTIPLACDRFVGMLKHRVCS